MKPIKFRKFILAITALVLMVALWLFRENSSEIPAVEIAHVPEPEATVSADSPRNSLQKSVQLPNPSHEGITDPEPTAELLATRRMIVAHASLRTDQVNNPDSIENKRVMQQMMANVLNTKFKTSVKN